MPDDISPTPAVQAILDAYSDVDGVYVDRNGIQIHAIDLCQDAPAGNAIVLSSPDGLPENQIVIVNPPILIPDVSGDIDKNGVMFRSDPLGAIAEVVRQYGGVTQ